MLTRFTFVYRVLLDNLSSLLSSTPLVFLGKLSYAIYLVHYPILIYFLGTNATAQQALHTRMVCGQLSVISKTDLE